MPIVALGFGLSACEGGLQGGLADLDFDLRGEAGGLDTSEAARVATQNRPKPDAQGVISYPNYQVAVANRGDTINSLATRIGANPAELARYNGRRVDDPLNAGEVIALPRKIATAPTETKDSPLDVTQIATSAIDRANPAAVPAAVTTKRVDGPEPIRHQVERGETAYSISRLYNVSPRALSDWNGLGPDLGVREGQFLLIPVAKDAPRPKTTEVAAITPGAGTQTPAPPSASKPLPEPVEPATPAVATKPATSAFLQPVSGKVLRPYKKRKNEGIDIAAAPGTGVKAAADGEVAAITRDTDQVPILVLRHSGNVLTVYANITDIAVKKGSKIKRGQTIAKVGSGDPAFLHFEVREGFESVDPAKYLK